MLIFPKIESIRTPRTKFLIEQSRQTRPCFIRVLHPRGRAASGGASHAVATALEQPCQVLAEVSSVFDTGKYSDEYKKTHEDLYILVQLKTAFLWTFSFIYKATITS